MPQITVFGCVVYFAGSDTSALWVTACGVRQSFRLEWRTGQLGHISNQLRWEVSD
jgi:hypothetical protein